MEDLTTKIKIENKIIELQEEIKRCEDHIKNDLFNRITFYENLRIESLILLKHYTNLLNTYNRNN